MDTRRSIVVRINDRGPFIEGRIIDLSKGAAEELGIVDKGITKVGLRIVRWP
ncbi:septal ring lytic transglycosylase RlpA family protein [Candidatus Bipolaricaulota bacterium]